MKKVIEVLSAIAGAILSFFADLPPVIWVLIAVMTLDFVTGLITGAMGKSMKTETGRLSSHAAFIGLLKKVLIITIVLLAALVDRAVAMTADIQFTAVVWAVCLWFIASEGLSIIENVASIGIPIPKVLRQALEILREKGEGTKEPEDTTEEKKNDPQNMIDPQNPDWY